MENENKELKKEHDILKLDNISLKAGFHINA